MGITSAVLTVLCLLVCGLGLLISGQVVTYPALPSSQYASTRFQVAVVDSNGVSSSAYVYASPNAYTAFPVSAAYMSLYNHFTAFSFNGAITVKVTLPLRSTAITTVEVRPLHAGIKATWTGNVISIPLTQPGNFYLFVGGEEKHPLFLFANPLEVNPPPSSGGSGVFYLNPGTHTTFTTTATTWYFRPGLHDIGTTGGTLQNIPSGTTVYFAGGSYVRGKMVAKGAGKTTFCGRGLLSGIGIAHQNGYGGFSIDAPSTLIEVKDIIISDSAQYHIVSYPSGVVIHNVKVMSWHLETDAFTVGPNARISNCFVKINDDSIKLTSSNIIVTDTVLYQQMGGNAVQLGWNNINDVSNCVVDGLDIVGCDAAAWNSNRTDIDVVSLRNINGATYNNITIKNVRSDVRLYQIWGMHIKDTMTGFTQGLGTADGIRFETFDFPKGVRNAGVFDGNGANSGEIRNVTFYNVNIGGVPLNETNADAYVVRYGKTSNFVHIQEPVTAVTTTTSATTATTSPSSGGSGSSSPAGRIESDFIAYLQNALLQMNVF